MAHIIVANEPAGAVRPRGRLELNYSNRFVGGQYTPGDADDRIELMHFCVPDERGRWFDLVTGDAGTLVGNLPAPIGVSNRLRGTHYGTKFDGASYFYWPLKKQLSRATDGGYLSMAVGVGRQWSAVSEAFCMVGNISGSNYTSARLDRLSTQEIRTRVSTNADANSSISTSPDTYVRGVRFTGRTAHNYRVVYPDSPASSYNSSISNVGTTMDYFVVGASWGSTGFGNYCTTGMEYAALWAGSMTGDPSRKFSLAPWQIVKRSPPRTYFFPPQRPEKAPAVIVPGRHKRQPERVDRVADGWLFAWSATDPWRMATRNGPIGITSRFGTNYLQSYKGTTRGAAWYSPKGSLPTGGWGIFPTFNAPIVRTANLSVIAVGYGEQSGEGFGGIVSQGAAGAARGWDVGRDSFYPTFVLNGGTTQVSDSSLSFPNGPWFMRISSRVQLGSLPRRIQINGSMGSSPTNNDGNVVPAQPGDVTTIGRNLRYPSEYWDNGIVMVAVTDRLTSDGEGMALYQDPWQVFKASLHRAYFYPKPMQPRRVWTMVPGRWDRQPR